MRKWRMLSTAPGRWEVELLYEQLIAFFLAYLLTFFLSFITYLHSFFIFSTVCFFPPYLISSFFVSSFLPFFLSFFQLLCLSVKLVSDKKIRNSSLTEMWAQLQTFPPGWLGEIVLARAPAPAIISEISLVKMPATSLRFIFPVTEVLTLMTAFYPHQCTVSEASVTTHYTDRNWFAFNMCSLRWLCCV